MNGKIQIAAWSYVLDDPMRILVVDDDPILREFASVHLSTPSATVESAANGEIALRLLKDSPFDAVLSDLEMPVLDGFSLLEKLRADADLCHMPVIMLTGHDDIGSIDRAYGLGATAFATKPVNWRQLSYVIRYVLRANRTERDLRHARDLAVQNELSSREAFAALERQHHDHLNEILECIAAHQTDHSSDSSDRSTTPIARIETLARKPLIQGNRPSSTCRDQDGQPDRSNGCRLQARG
jgi:DNA-binding response OmpR family regulator